ncbi:MAG: hypothetical protein A3D65_04955 [Candidatus Lloydbacteria bacterium RIFCSPHIGHO2_02_FULL_50_13]|uniref:Uncharacterized protein n=1 Tax=Candidatus Lloydbacteria bacterium RIFCSPHIGHO2_02_FULL_50_13 TaxID=1798661 RepID=A0A1G2D4L5_9BACT|nr:MAG: hypothetical protein A3D65_04955 [Candidatus Lloydbacteria bacterium RIFCSPHIGHO2_02_FULL_50_13]
MSIGEVAGGSTRELLAELIPGEGRRTRTARAVAAVAPSDIRVELAAELSATLAKSGKLTAEERQALAQRILSATVTEMRVNLPEDQKVLAELLKSLDDDLANIGGAIGEFQTFNTQEQGLINAANQLVASAEGHVTLAKTKLAGLESAWFFKDSRMATAKVELENTEKNVVSAKLGVAQARDQAKIDQEKRLLNADFTVLYDRFTKRIEATCKVLETSRDGAWENYNQVVEQLRITHEDKTGAAAAMEKLDGMISEASQKLEQDKEQCATLTPGTAERTTLEQAISEQVNRVQELQGKRNEALAIFQAKERATPELETHRDTILAQYHVHRMNLASLRANSDSCRTAFDSRLEQMKGMSSIDASGKIDSVGAAIAQRGAEQAAQAMIASVRQAVEMIEQHPERLEKLMHVQDAQQEGMAELLARLQKASEASMNRGGRIEEHQPSGDSDGTGTGS